MQLRTFRAIVAIGALFAVSMPAAGAANPKPTAAMMKPIQTALVAVNTGNSASLASGVYTSDATITDEFSPYVWTGSNAGVQWITDFVKFAKQAHLSVKGTFMPVTAFEQSANRAYIVVPVNFSGTMGGKPAKESGTWTFTLQRSGSGWLILTESWGTMSSSM